MIEFNYIDLTTGERHFVSLCRFKEAPMIVTQNFLFHKILKQSIEKLDNTLEAWRTYYTNPLDNHAALSNEDLKKQIATLSQNLIPENLKTQYRELAEKNVYININNFNDNNLICIRKLKNFSAATRKKLEAHLPTGTAYDTTVLKYSYDHRDTADINFFTATTVSSTVLNNNYELRGMVNHRLHTIGREQHV